MDIVRHAFRYGNPISLHSVTSSFWGFMSISSQDLIVFFASFGVALVALNLYKLSQPAKG